MTIGAAHFEIDGIAGHRPGDPLAHDFPLELKARFFPLGFTLDIETNSPGIIGAARELWSGYPRLSNAPPITLRVAVENRGARTAPRPSLPRAQRHLVTTIHGPDNFAICDLSAGFGFVWLTRDVAADRAYFRYHFLEPAVYLLIEAGDLAPVHASCVALNGRAVLLCGDSGAGKTSFAYQCAKRGWTYISDDATHVVRSRPDHTIAGRPFRIRFRESATSLFPELRGFKTEPRPNGKRDLEIETKHLNFDTAVESKAGWVIFLNRRDSATQPKIEPFPRVEAMSHLTKVLCYGDEEVRKEQAHTINRTLELPVLQITYSALTEAEEALRELAGSG